MVTITAKQAEALTIIAERKTREYLTAVELGVSPLVLAALATKGLVEYPKTTARAYGWDTDPKPYRITGAGFSAYKRHMAA